MLPSRTTPPAALLPAGTDDDRLLVLWLHGKSAHTREAYARDVARFRAFLGRPLSAVTLGDLQDWADALEAEGLADASRRRRLGAVKSLMTFGHKLGYLPFNVGAALGLPSPRNDLSQRILPELVVLKILLAETQPRHALLLRLFYATAGRVSEVVALRWRDCVPRVIEGEARGQVALYGKGGKLGYVVLTADTWSAIEAFRADAVEAGHGAPADPVFRGRGGRPLSRIQAWRIVKRAARRAGAPEAASPHWFRHAHISHALDNGAPLHEVKETARHASLATTSQYAHARPTRSSSLYLKV